MIVIIINAKTINEFSREGGKENKHWVSTWKPMRIKVILKASTYCFMFLCAWGPCYTAMEDGENRSVCWWG